jgi:hypothetical protein
VELLLLLGFIGELFQFGLVVDVSEEEAQLLLDQFVVIAAEVVLYFGFASFGFDLHGFLHLSQFLLNFLKGHRLVLRIR